MAVSRPQYKDKKTEDMKHTDVWYCEFMFAGTCNGAMVFMFSRDLEEGAKPIADARVMKSGA